MAAAVDDEDVTVGIVEARVEAGVEAGVRPISAQLGFPRLRPGRAPDRDDAADQRGLARQPRRREEALIAASTSPPKSSP